MGYNGINLRNSISVSKIYSIHYFEYMSDFTFEGESHNFWEFICVDKGEVGVTAGDALTAAWTTPICRICPRKTRICLAPSS